MITLVNVCGASRSGTTLLDVMLGNREDAFSCGEIYAWFRPWREHHQKIQCACGKDPCSVWREIAHVEESIFHRHASEVLEKSFIIDSSKRLRWLWDTQKWAYDSGMQVFNLLIHKPPLELSFSHFKRKAPPLRGERILSATIDGCLRVLFPLQQSHIVNWPGAHKI